MFLVGVLCFSLLGDPLRSAQPISCANGECSLVQNTLSTFDDRDDAAKALDAAAKKLHDQAATLEAEAQRRRAAPVTSSGQPFYYYQTYQGGCAGSYQGGYQSFQSGCQGSYQERGRLFQRGQRGRLFGGGRCGR